jgi:AraC family transcriptional regulator of adaptative response/methylated-DNA-[protein]-cysteine methyltransferase
MLVSCSKQRLVAERGDFRSLDASGDQAMQEATMWQAVLERDRACDGEFVFAVRTTGVYCRPSCPARRPRRENVCFFERPAQAEAAGFRPCQRCHPDQAAPPEPNLALMQAVCRAIMDQSDRPPTLEELGRQFGMSPFHLQRTFKRIVGVTPKQYAAAQRAERLKRHLKEKTSVTEAIYEAGYPSSSSAYAQATSHLGMTPAAYRRGGQATAITFAIAPCPLGYLLVAATPNGLCAVRLGDSTEELAAALNGEFPAASVQPDDGRLGPWVASIQDYLAGAQPHFDLPLDVRATAFQHRVWQALQAIPYGSTRSYREVAEAIGQPTAARAVARACATNPVALVVPCHRVVREDGSLSGYRWGIQRKEALLALEAREADLPTATERRDAERRLV